MARYIKFLSTVTLISIILATLGGLTWGNTLFARENLGETDFLVPWLAAQTFLEYGNSPYSDPVTQRSQLIHYGRLADIGEDPLRLHVPFPAMFIYFPFALIDAYPLARGMWMTLLEIALVAFAFMTIKVSGWRINRFLLLALLLLSIFWVFGLFPLFYGQAIILVSLSTVGVLLALRGEQDELAGALLVPLLFKPSLCGLLFIFLMGSAIAHRRWGVLGGFLMASGILVGLSFLLLPDWLLSYLRSLVVHLSFNPGITPAGIFISIWPSVGKQIGWIITALLTLLLASEFRAMLQKDSRHQIWTSSLIIAASPLIGFPISPFDYLIMFIPLILILAIIAERWRGSQKWLYRSIVITVLLVTLWVWIWLYFYKPSSTEVAVNLTLVFPFLLLLGLYWIRWWAIHPPRTWFEIIRNELR